MQEIEHLGFLINSQTMQVTLTTDKARKILKLIHNALHDEIISIRQIARVIGKVNATSPGNKVAALFTKNLENDKIQALYENKFNYDMPMTLSQKSKNDLRWLIDNLSHSSAPVRIPKPDFVIYTDASREGWGCYNPQTGQKAGGRWSVEEQNDHINTLELKAIWLSLLSHVKNKTGGHVRVMTDNTTALACINKQGSTRSQKQNSVTREIWELALRKQFWISAAHIPGKDNVEADEASRVFNDSTEWSLRNDIFDTITSCFGKPTLDLFASRLNYKTKRYCAWEPDPGAMVIDSFSYDWGKEELGYAFPPFSVIHMVLRKLIQDEAEMIIIAPFWPTQPWFTLLANTIVQEPLVFEVNNNELYLPFRKQTTVRVRPDQAADVHPLVGKLRMLAARCSGKHWQQGASPQGLSIPSLTVEDRPQISCTAPMLQNGGLIVSDWGQIPFHLLSLKS